MRQIRQVLYALLYLQFFVRDVFTLDTDVLSEKYTSDTSDIAWIDNWECESNDDCTVTDSTCEDFKCQCAPGYIYNSDMTSCVRVATGVNDPCIDSVQCSAYLFTGGQCVDNICICGRGYHYLHGRCYRSAGLSEKCKKNVDCHVNADFEASTCTAEICECSPGFYQREYRTCRRQGNAVGEECTIDLDCTFENATCKDFICVEKSESNESAEFSTDIVLTATDEPTEIRVGSKCTIDEDCTKELGNAICDLTGTCRCDRAHFAPDEDAKCIPELGEPCNSDDVAGIERSICRKVDGGEGIWSCTNGTVASRDNHECRNATTEYGEQCYKDEDCYIFGPDAKCEEEKCICNARSSHYEESELFCWGSKGIGETCRQNRDCYIEGFESELECKDGKCGCPDGMQPNRNKTACISKTPEIGEMCVVDEDCVTENAICNAMEMCECKEHYYLSEDLQKCVPGFQAPCEYDEDCYLTNSMCRNNVCSCITKYVSVTIDKCLPKMPYGNTSCEYDVQCSSKTPGAICAIVEKEKKEEKEEKDDTICTCVKEDHYRYGRCFKKKMLSEVCTNIGECYLNYNLDAVMCMNGKCACNWGYMKWNNSVCLQDKRTPHFLNDGVTRMMSTGLFSVALLLASCSIF